VFRERREGEGRREKVEKTDEVGRREKERGRNPLATSGRCYQK
jgi:hypothetical protein